MAKLLKQTNHPFLLTYDNCEYIRKLYKWANFYDHTWTYSVANDAIGYIIPKSEWDNVAPWIYDETEETYGEVVSLGPNTAPIIHQNIIKLIEKSKD